MNGSLDTTNLLLGIMAAVSVLEGIVLSAAIFAGWKFYTKVMKRLDEFEDRHVAPVAARVNGILDDLKDVATTIKEEAERVDRSIHRTIDRADNTARWVKSTVVARTGRAVGVMRGVAVALDTLFGNGQHESTRRT